MKLPNGPLCYPLGTTELGNETTRNQASACLASLGFTSFPQTPTRAASLGLMRLPKIPQDLKAPNLTGPYSFSGETGIGGLRWLERPRKPSENLGVEVPSRPELQ